MSLSGRAPWRDNVSVERLWRSVKCERVCLKAHDGVSAARADIAEYRHWYNTHRPHSSLDNVTPEQAYLDALSKMAKAAQYEFTGAPRVAHRVGRFVASADCRRGQLCAFTNPPGLHLSIGEGCASKRGHFSAEGGWALAGAGKRKW